MVEPADFTRFDLILAMDQENLRVLQRRAPDAAHERLHSSWSSRRTRTPPRFLIRTTAAPAFGFEVSAWWKLPRGVPAQRTCALRRAA